MKKVKFTFHTDEVKEGIMEQDERFWGGYKIIYENSIIAIKLVKIIE